mmetsp:Transcript_67033/g.145732  ORF Transcript_67033/g.145732 Transcript_67033/m.145732 type:complete len:220 (+) Transcript_67033:382-1041(+)
MAAFAATSTPAAPPGPASAAAAAAASEDPRSRRGLADSRALPPRKLVSAIHRNPSSDRLGTASSPSGRRNLFHPSSGAAAASAPAAAAASTSNSTFGTSTAPSVDVLMLPPMASSTPTIDSVTSPEADSGLLGKLATQFRDTQELLARAHDRIRKVSTWDGDDRLDQVCFAHSKPPSGSSTSLPSAEPEASIAPSSRAVDASAWSGGTGCFPATDGWAP